jgi:hypothetical protein
MKKKEDVPNKDESKYEERPKREKLSREEILRRMADFPKRKAKIIAAIRKAKG